MKNLKNINILHFFIMFLIKENAFISYKKELIRNKGNIDDLCDFCSINDIFKFEKKIRPFELINNAFRWTNTLNGYDYWYNLYSKWMNMINNHSCSNFYTSSSIPIKQVHKMFNYD